MVEVKLFHKRILRACIDSGDTLALLDSETNESLTFDALHARSHALARLLYEQYGLEKGQAVVCFMPNNIHYPVIFLASAVLGAPFCGIAASLSKEEIGELLEQTSCRVLFTTSELLDKVIQKADELRVPVFVLGKLSGQHGVDLEKIFDEISPKNDKHDHLMNIKIDPDDCLMMALSSGTTGKPKCALLTHRNFNAATDSLKEVVFDKLSTRGLKSRATIALLPFCHASGFWALCYCLLSGHHSIVMNRFDAYTFLSTINAHAIDTINLVPSLINFLVKNGAEIAKRFSLDLSSVRTVLCGSAAIGNEQVKECLRLFPQVDNFLCGYGMTEVVVLSHITPLDLTPNEWERHKNSCGKLLPSFEAKIVDIDSCESITAPGKSGELWLKSECVMLGYLNEKESCVDSEGFYHTGDVVHVDSHGYYYIDGRIKNIIKVNGMQVSQTELESVLLSHADVLEAAVIGVPDADRGEVPKAFIVLTVGCSAERIADKIAEIREFVHGRVAPYKQLAGGIVPVVTLPKTPSGKVAKGSLRDVDPQIPKMNTNDQIGGNAIEKKVSNETKNDTAENEQKTML